MTHESFLPLTPAVFHILLALADEDRHGYAIMQEVLRRAGITLGPGTLYGTIKRLLADGLIAELGDRPDPDNDRRRYYRLTALGRRVTSAEARRMAELVRVSRRKHLLEPAR
jgi:DNA-binding PadR family transcriptional regulator